MWRSCRFRPPHRFDCGQSPCLTDSPSRGECLRPATTSLPNARARVGELCNGLTPTSRLESPHCRPGNYSKKQARSPLQHCEFGESCEAAAQGSPGWQPGVVWVRANPAANAAHRKHPSRKAPPTKKHETPRHPPSRRFDRLRAVLYNFPLSDSTLPAIRTPLLTADENHHQTLKPHPGPSGASRRQVDLPPAGHARGHRQWENGHSGIFRQRRLCRHLELPPTTWGWH